MRRLGAPGGSGHVAAVDAQALAIQRSSTTGLRIGPLRSLGEIDTKVSI
jgi:hypothetical protein